MANRIYGRISGNVPAKNTIYTLNILQIWFWPTLHVNRRRWHQLCEASILEWACHCDDVEISAAPSAFSSTICIPYAFSSTICVESLAAPYAFSSTICV